MQIAMTRPFATALFDLIREYPRDARQNFSVLMSIDVNRGPCHGFRKIKKINSSTSKTDGVGTGQLRVEQTALEFLHYPPANNGLASLSCNILFPAQSVEDAKPRRNFPISKLCSVVNSIVVYCSIIFHSIFPHNPSRDLYVLDSLSRVCVVLERTFGSTSSMLTMFGSRSEIASLLPRKTEIRT